VILRIAVNTQHLLGNKLEGIGWFAHETLSRMVRRHPEHEFLFIFDRPWSPSFVYGPNVIPVKTMLPSRHPLLWIWHYEVEIPHILRKYKPDLFFSPDGWMSLITKVPTIDVIHDINFMHRPKDLPWLVRKYCQFFFPRFARKAKKIITVSDFSKTDLVETLHLAQDKIQVVYNGCNPEYVPLPVEVRNEVRNRFTGGSPFFIFIGARIPRKNILGLLKAFEQFKATDDNDYKMLFVGEPMWNDTQLAEQLEQMHYKTDLVFTGRLSTEVLQMVLASADALTLVSFFEGFGVPLIEAMYCDVPVICSNRTALPEVAGDAALLVDPSSVTEIAHAMQQIARYPELRKSLIMKGRVQRKKFDWDQTADQLWTHIERTAQKL
jgi:glycosyltransferase involved in cell wall biosynthesis